MRLNNTKYQFCTIFYYNTNLLNNIVHSYRFAQLITIILVKTPSKLYTRNFFFKSKYNKPIYRSKTKFQKTFPINLVAHCYIHNSAPKFNTSAQNEYLFFKRKFGLFKHVSSENKRVKNQLIYISNLIKFNRARYKYKTRTAKIKIIFYKKINKLFFRAGRRLLVPFIKIKKSYNQTFLSKRLCSNIKSD